MKGEAETITGCLWCERRIDDFEHRADLHLECWESVRDDAASFAGVVCEEPISHESGGWYCQRQRVARRNGEAAGYMRALKDVMKFLETFGENPAADSVRLMVADWMRGQDAYE